MGELVRVVGAPAGDGGRKIPSADCAVGADKGAGAPEPLLCACGLADARKVRRIELCGDEVADLAEPREIDPCLDSEPLEKIRHVFRGHVSGRAAGVGTAAEAADGGVDDRDAVLERHGEIRQRRPVRVVEVNSKFVDGRHAENGLEHVRGRAGGPHANRVAERHLVAAHCKQLAGDERHGVGADLAFVGAPEHARNVASHLDPVRVGFDHDLAAPCKRLVDRAVCVLLTERLGRGGEDGDLADAHLERLLQPLHVRHEGRERYFRKLGAAEHFAQNLVGAFHHGHPLGRHERARFDGADARVCKHLNELDLHLDRDLGGGLEVLQTVAR
eukprot:Amastigsp_a677102_82.p2 type:complete len:330 gc:universal Amastigsp_a677102_82:72-1061(+)